MKTSRLEAFSDGVLAIIITIMVLELEPPEEISIEALIPKLPIFISYLLSFIYVGIFWNNHHHLFQIAEKVNGKILWANLHLLFWLSLIPFASAWLGENHLEIAPVLLYGFSLLMSSVAFWVLKTTILNYHNKNVAIKTAFGKGNKEKLSCLIYIIGISLAYFSPWVAIASYVIVALMWIIPDKRIESNIN